MSSTFFVLTLARLFTTTLLDDNSGDDDSSRRQDQEQQQQRQQKSAALKSQVLRQAKCRGKARRELRSCEVAGVERRRHEAMKPNPGPETARPRPRAAPPRRPGPRPSCRCGQLRERGPEVENLARVRARRDSCGHSRGGCSCVAYERELGKLCLGESDSEEEEGELGAIIDLRERSCSCSAFVQGERTESQLATTTGATAEMMNLGPERSVAESGESAGGSARTPSYGTTLRERAEVNARLCALGTLAGAGMFNESYFLFAIGNLELIWEALYPECYTTGPPEPGAEACKNGVASSITYLEVLGVIAGMLSFGYVADTFGRRIGSCLTAVIMCVCGILTTAAYGHNLTGQWIFFGVALFFFSYGVGGEFPLASASAAEKAEEARKKKSITQHIRGKSVVLTFAMQGVGNFANTLFILFILLGQGCTGPSEECSDRSLELTWRLQYAIGVVFLAFLVIGRLVYLKESTVWSANKAKQSALGPQQLQQRRRRARLVLKHYWHRLAGTSVSWFVWDAIYYGNKLFQNTIIAAIIGRGSTIFRTLQYALVNSAVALIALYMAAFFIDKPWMGRRRMQNLGFALMFVLFLISSLAYDELAKPENVPWFQALYYLTTFFGQFGPNATTWLLPSELFPTDVRSQAHGFAASIGKVGALFAALLLTYGDAGEKWSVQTIFMFCAVCAFVGLLVTETLIPDISTMDMSHTDDRWDLILAGREQEYTGAAVEPKYLSRYERAILPAKKPSPPLDQVQASSSNVDAKSRQSVPEDNSSSTVVQLA